MQLMDSIDAIVIEIEADDVRAARHALDGQDFVKSVAQLGNRLHALLDPHRARSGSAASGRCSNSSGCRARSSACAPVSKTCSSPPRGFKATTTRACAGAGRVHRSSRIFAIATKEIRQLRRDRLTFGMIVGIPLIQMLLFGYAINFDVRGLSAGVVDEAQNLDVACARRRHAGDRRHPACANTQAPSATCGACCSSGEVSVGVYIPAGFRAPTPGSATGRWRSCSSMAASRRSRTSRVRSPPCRCRRAPASIARRPTGVRGAHRVQPGEAHGRADRAGADRRDPDA